LMANFGLAASSNDALRLSDTITWFAHNAMIHYAAPRGIKQYDDSA